MKLLSPAGAPIPVRAILSSVLEGQKGQNDLTKLLRERLGIRHVHFVSSGRAALTIVLRALQRLSDRREVIIPAYTCFSVPSAVARAGLTIRLCDVDPKTLDMNHNALARLDLGTVLCTASSGMSGSSLDLAASDM